jgi:hypothetical protein
VANSIGSNRQALGDFAGQLVVVPGSLVAAIEPGCSLVESAGPSHLGRHLLHEAIWL